MQAHELNKDLVRERFEKSFARKQSPVVIQPQMAKHLIGLLVQSSPARCYRTVLEPGCGSTSLAKALVTRVTIDHYAANDIADAASAFGRIAGKLPLKSRAFIQGDMDSVEFPNGQDLIISNAAIQWSVSPAELVNRLIDKLSPEGILAFSTFGLRNLHQVRELAGASLDYMQVSDYQPLIEGKGQLLCLEDGEMVLEFDSPVEVLRHLKQTGVNALSRRAWTKSDLQIFSERYRERFSRGNKVLLTYHPVYVIFKRDDELS